MKKTHKRITIYFLYAFTENSVGRKGVLICIKPHNEFQVLVIDSFVISSDKYFNRHSTPHNRHHNPNNMTKYHYTPSKYHYTPPSLTLLLSTTYPLSQLIFPLPITLSSLSPPLSLYVYLIFVFT